MGAQQLAAVHGDERAQRSWPMLTDELAVVRHDQLIVPIVDTASRFDAPNLDEL